MNVRYRPSPHPRSFHKQRILSPLPWNRLRTLLSLASSTPPPRLLDPFSSTRSLTPTQTPRFNPPTTSRRSLLLLLRRRWCLARTSSSPPPLSQGKGSRCTLAISTPRVPSVGFSAAVSLTWPSHLSISSSAICRYVL